jgi:hypothetical protein
MLKYGELFIIINKKEAGAMSKKEAKNPQITEQNPQKTRKVVFTTIIGVAFVVAVVAGFIYQHNKLKEQEDQLNQQLQLISDLQAEKAAAEDSIIEESTPTITSEQVSEELRDLDELVTMEYLYTNADKYENQLSVSEWNIDIPLTKKSFLLAYDGRIKAGVDLSGVDISVTEESREIVVTLPRSEIVSHEIFEDNIRVFDEKDNIFNKITIDNYNSFLSEQKTVMEEKAVEQGLLTSADENARTIVKSFLRLLPGMDTYTLTVQSADGE